MIKVKICGITNLQEIELVNKYKPDFAGFVLDFPKSKRNISWLTAAELIGKLDESIKSVAVMVSPTYHQIETARACNFDYVQIHGEVDDALLDNPFLPVLRAFNVSDIDRFEQYSRIDNIKGYVFDSAVPGSGKKFDWNLLDKIDRNGKMFLLAGGLNQENVAEAIAKVKPDGVDVSSGVENDDGVGKSEHKIKDFIRNARKVTK